MVLNPIFFLVMLIMMNLHGYETCLLTKNSPCEKKKCQREYCIWVNVRGMIRIRSCVTDISSTLLAGRSGVRIPVGATDFSLLQNVAAGA
jgi:hypothetical protein